MRWTKFIVNRSCFWVIGQQVPPLTFDATTDGFIGIGSDNNSSANFGCGQGNPQFDTCLTNGCGTTCVVNIGDVITPLDGSKWHNGPHEQSTYPTIVGETVEVLVYATVNSTPYTVVGFVTLKLGPEDANENITATFEGATVAASGSGSGPFYGTASVSITQ